VSDDVAVFVLNLEALLLYITWWALLGVKLFAACDAAMRKDRIFVAADKQNKAFWLLLLIVFLALHAILRYSPINLLNLIGTVAALVYLADVRPALGSMRHR
jgi:hypothetical protein